MTTFEEQWQLEERQGLMRRMREERPLWARRRRQRRTAVAAVAVVAGVALSTLHFPLSSQGYEGVCCNRSGIADSHWAEEAGRILTLES